MRELASGTGSRLIHLLASVYTQSSKQDTLTHHHPLGEDTYDRQGVGNLHASLVLSFASLCYADAFLALLQTAHARRVS